MLLPPSPWSRPVAHPKRWWRLAAVLLPAALALTWWWQAQGSPPAPAPPHFPVAALLGALLATCGFAWWQHCARRTLQRTDAALAQALAQVQQGLRADPPWTPVPTGQPVCDALLAALAEAHASHAAALASLQQRLAAAQARASRADPACGAQRQSLETVGRVAADVAQEVDGLLSVIGNSAHLLRRLTSAEGPVAHPVAVILRAVTQGGGLAQALQALADATPRPPRPLDLRQEWAAVEPLLRSVLGRRIVLRTSVDPDTLPVRADQQALRRALLALALNARDAVAQQGKVWLRARNAEAEADEGLPWPAHQDAVLITLDDDGCGLDEAGIERAFEPFFSTKPVDLAAGLGLCQVRAFCEQSGGLARLASTPGLGTTVSLLLPACQEAPEPERPASRLPPLMAGTRVLVVDPHEELGHTIGLLLSCHGCAVSWVRGAADALNRLAREPFDLVLSEWAMPGGIDGPTLARMLQRTRPALPVVLIGRRADAPDVAGPLSQFQVLPRPCPPGPLLVALRQALARRGAVSAEAPPPRRPPPQG